MKSTTLLSSRNSVLFALLITSAIVSLILISSSLANVKQAGFEAEQGTADNLNSTSSLDASGDAFVEFNQQTVSDIPYDRFYPGWCGLEANNLVSSRPATAQVAAGDDIQAALDSNTDGVVVLESGTHIIDQTITMRQGVVLRGQDGTRLVTSGPMVNMISFGGGFNGDQSAKVTKGEAFSYTLEFSQGDITPGYWIIGDSNAGQMVKVVSVSENRAQLELPLAQDFTGFTITNQKTPLSGSGLESLILEPRHDVQDLILVRSTSGVWIDGISTEGLGGQIRSAIFMRQAYRTQISNNTITDAGEHGDGGQGYGINLANNTSNSVINNNRLRKLRHSILIQAGASGNLIIGNDSADPKHPNFVEGGPADISYHGYASSNLSISNQVDRIQINDAGSPGPHNALILNDLRSGPLTLDNGVDRLTLLGNRMIGDVETLRNRTMPPIATDSTAGNPSPERPFWQSSYDPFEGPGGNETQFTERGVGILDWGSGDDIYIDTKFEASNTCRPAA